MSHQCVRCNTFYGDGSAQLLTGCSKCGGKFFFFIKKEHIDDAKKITENLSVKDKERIEKDVFDIMGSEIDREKPVVLDLETIRVLKPGKYDLDIVKLFQKHPLVYRLEEGKYMIDLISTFDKE